VPCRSANRVFLLSQVFSARESCAFVTFSSPGVVCRALPHSSGASRHRTFPQLNLHRDRVRRNHGRLPSHGFIERAPEHRARVNFFPESAPPINANVIRPQSLAGANRASKFPGRTCGSKRRPHPSASVMSGVKRFGVSLSLCGFAPTAEVDNLQGRLVSLKESW